jgi:hypothetical protein
MTCGLSEQELYIIFRITLYNRWCNKHMKVESITRGIPGHKVGLCREAVRSPIRKGYLKGYHAQGRTDVCAVKQHRETFIQSMDARRDEYPFLKRFDRGRIR